MDMNIQEQIKTYIANQPEAKHSDVQLLHNHILQVLRGCKLWFDNGLNSEGKAVTNPTIGYGFFTIKYADGKTKDFFQIRLSANKTGISIYILGLEDKRYLAQTFGEALGKAKITGYCIKFNKLKDINIDVLSAAIQYGVGAAN